MDEMIKAKMLLRRASEELKAERANSKALLEVNEALEHENAELRDMIGPVNPRKLQPLSLSPSGTATAIMGVSDWHREMRITPESVGGVNEFDLDIGKRRIDRAFKSFVELTNCSRRISNIKSALLLVTGDLINNYLREEDMENNLLSPTRAVALVENDLHSGIKFLAENGGFDEIGVVFTYGNHARTCDRKRIATDWQNSYEWLIATNVSVRDYGKQKIDWSLSRGYHAYSNLDGFIIRSHHGDGLKYFGGVGGISVPANKAIAQWNKVRHADLDVFGHFHQLAILWPSWICCPSLCGYDSFALWIKAEMQAPGQLYAVIDKARGLVEAKPIFCEGAKK